MNMWLTPIGLIVLLAVRADAAVTGYSGAAARSESDDVWRKSAPTSHAATAYGDAGTEAPAAPATVGSELWTRRPPTATDAWRTVGVDAQATASTETPHTAVAYAYSSDTGHTATAWQSTRGTVTPRASTTWHWHSTDTDTRAQRTETETEHSDTSPPMPSTDRTAGWRPYEGGASSAPGTVARHSTSTDDATATSSESAGGGSERARWHTAVQTYAVAALFTALGVVMLLAFAVAAVRSCCGKARRRRKRSLLDDDDAENAAAPAGNSAHE